MEGELTHSSRLHSFGSETAKRAMSKVCREKAAPSWQLGSKRDKEFCANSPFMCELQLAQLLATGPHLLRSYYCSIDDDQAFASKPRH